MKGTLDIVKISVEVERMNECWQNREAGGIGAI